MVGQGRPLICAARRARIAQLLSLLWCNLIAHAIASAQEVAPPAAIRVTTEASQLIFSPAAEARFALEIDAPEDTAGRFVDLRVEMVALRDGTSVWADQQDVRAPVDDYVRHEFAVPLPAAEGVYELRIAAASPRAFQPFSLAKSARPFATRRAQLVVFDNEATAAPVVPPDQWQLVDQIEPTNPRWWQRMPQWTQIDRVPGLSRRGLAGSGPPQIVRRDGDTFLKLPPPPSRNEPHWQAYTLPIAAVGLPHFVEVEFPSGEEMQFGVTVLQPDGSGAAGSDHIESTVFSGPITYSELDSPETHRVVFWPTTRSPVLLVTNGHPDRAAYVGRIRVFVRPDVAASVESPAQASRLVAVYLPQGHLQVPLASSASPSPATPTATPEWRTHAAGAQHLAEFVHLAGYNAAVAPLPLANVAPLLNGELPAPDGSELLLRTFDRAGVRFVPLFTLRDARPTAAADLATSIRDTLLRYGHHASITDVAVQVSAGGLRQLRDTLAPANDANLQQFAQAAGFDVNVPVRRAIDTTHQSEWHRWQAARVTAYFNEVAELVRVTEPNRQLLVLLSDLLQSPELEARLRPAVLGTPSLEASLLTLGLDATALSRLPGVVVARPQFVSPEVPLVDRAMDLERSTLAMTLAEGGPVESIGLQAIRRATRSPLTSVPSNAARQSTADELALWSCPHPAGASARSPVTSALANQDAAIVLSGGQKWVPVVDTELSRVIRTVGSLPPADSRTIDRREQSVVVRSHEHRDGTVISVVNDSPWRATAILTLDLAGRAHFSPLVDDVGTPSAGLSSFAAGRPVWKVELAPHDLQAFRFDGTEIKLAGLQVETNAAAHAALAERIESLTRRNLTDDTMCRYDVLANPSFEELGGETPSAPVAGWTVLNPSNRATIGYSQIEVPAGRSSLLMESPGVPVGIESHEFPIPHTGQLAMVAYLRGEATDESSQVRMVFEADGPPVYRRMIVVGGEAEPVPTEGKLYAFGVQDLPLDSRATMRIRFEFLGPGRVWFDGVTLHNMLFPLKNYEQSEQQRYTLLKTIRAAGNAHAKGDLADCQRLLDSYWPRFVETYVPESDPAEAIVRPEAATPPVANDDADGAEAPPTPSLSERIRRLWRF